MRVDGTQGTGPQNPLRDPAPVNKPDGAAIDKRKAAQEAPKASAGPEIVLSNEKYIQAAARTEELDLQAIAEARELLQSGQLDTPQAAQRAAENIARLGL